MTAPISNEPTTTRLHHYAGRYSKKCPNWAFYGVLGEFCPAHAVRRGVQGEFCTGDAADGGVLGEFSAGCGGGGGVPGEFFAELLRDGPQWVNFFAEESLKALMVNVCMCARSPCGRLSSAGDTFRMQFPSRYFKL